MTNKIAVTVRVLVNDRRPIWKYARIRSKIAGAFFRKKKKHASE